MDCVHFSESKLRSRKNKEDKKSGKRYKKEIYIKKTSIDQTFKDTMHYDK